MPPDVGNRFLCLADFEPASRELLPHAVYEFLAAGAGEEITKPEMSSDIPETVALLASWRNNPQLFRFGGDAKRRR